MTEIGRSTPELSTAASSVTRGGHSHGSRMHALLESLTHSLDLACRGYLCAPLVDCDPFTDPECGPTGKKVQLPKPAADPVRAVVSREIFTGTGSESIITGSDSIEKVRAPESRLEESLHENVPRK